MSETYLSDVEKLFIVRLCDTMCSSENGSVEPFVGAPVRVCVGKKILCDVAKSPCYAMTPHPMIRTQGRVCTATILKN